MAFRNDEVTAPLKLQVQKTTGFIWPGSFRNDEVTAPLKLQRLVECVDEFVPFRNDEVTAPLKRSMSIKPDLCRCRLSVTMKLRPH